MKKVFGICLLAFMLVLNGCNTTSKISDSYTSDEKGTVSNTIDPSYDESISNSDKDNVTNTDYNDIVSFSNKYGTSTTICAHTGCTNYIASSGDTNCCTAHSNQCLDCNCYIDEDAIWCISCLQKAAEKAAQTNKHECEVCGKEASYSIDGITGNKEYYCLTHYNEMKDLLDWMQES